MNGKRRNRQKKEAEAKAKKDAEEEEIRKGKEVKEKATALAKEKLKKEKAGQEALKVELQKKLTPSLVHSMAKAAVEATEDGDDKTESSDDKVTVLEAKKEEQEALVKEAQTRIDDAIDRVAENRAAVKLAISVGQAKAARAGIEVAQKDLKKDEAKKKGLQGKLEETKKEVGVAKVKEEAEEKKETEPVVDKVTQQMSPKDVVIAADDVARKMLKKQDKSPAETLDAVMTPAQKKAHEEEQVRSTTEVLNAAKKESTEESLKMQHAEDNVHQVIAANKAKALANTGSSSNNAMLAEATEQSLIPSNVNL